MEIKNRPTKSDIDQLYNRAKNPNIPKKFTVREHQPIPHFHRWIFPDDVKKFYYCHVNMDWLTVELTPPDVFTMAYETGLTMVGIGIALDVYIQMLNAGGWTYFLPHFYFTFYCPDKYLEQQKGVFDALAQFAPLVAEDLYMAGYYAARAGGGLSYYLYLIADWHQQLSLAEVNCLNILQKLYDSKEFSFIEYNLHDPTYGDLLFNNLTYAESNIRFNHDSTGQIGVNWNIINPWRFEGYLRSLVDGVWDATTTYKYMYEYHGITSNNTVNDSLSFVWGIDPINNIHIVKDVNFTQNISEQRSAQNLILEYTNKPVNNQYVDVSTEYWVIKSSNIDQFFRAASWFIQQAVITNYLYDTWQVDTGQIVEPIKQLWPPKMSLDQYRKFVNYQKETYSFGKALQSGVPSYMKDKLSEISSTGSSGSTGEC